MGSHIDNLGQLCEKLQSERLLLSEEASSIRELHNVIDNSVLQLSSSNWTCLQYQIIMRRLLSSHQLITPENALTIISQLEKVKVVEAYRRLGHHHSTVHRILVLLSQFPDVVAEILNGVDTNFQVTTEDAVVTLFSVVYGNCLHSEDEKSVLEGLYVAHQIVQVLSFLIQSQLLTSSNPRLVIRKGAAAFPFMYKLFSESMYSVKVFLTNSLHDSIMHVLCQDDVFLDIDPAKSPLRFPPAERVRRFGSDPSSPQFHRNLANHRKVIVEKLVLISHHFVKGILDALSNFPPSLIWLVQQLYTTLQKKEDLTKNEAILICTDLIVTNLLCPAITNPEAIGIISDTPIGHIARFNLMQIGQIVQTLCLCRFEPPPATYQVIMSQFNESPICRLIETVLPMPAVGLNSLFPESGSDSHSFLALAKTHFVGSLSQMNSLITILKSDVVTKISRADVRNEIVTLMKRIPNSFSSTLDSKMLASRSSTKTLPDRLHQNLQLRVSPKKGSAADSNELPLPAEFFDLISFQIAESRSAIGLIAEDKFIDELKNDLSKKSSGVDRKKRARFLDTASSAGLSDRTGDIPYDSGDDGDGASISSSQDVTQEDRLLLMEEDNASTLPDNLSDEGGISGRGSPSLSGRDTPLSQFNRDGEQEQESDLAAASTTPGAVHLNVSQRNLPPIPVTVRRQNAEGLEEKFGKFNLPASDQNRLYRDDQRSLLSESWSTNVAASDDESNAAQVLPPMAAEDGNRIGRHINRAGSIGTGPLAEDRSDTWSLDAVASDSEAERDRRLQDVQRDATRIDAQGENGLADGNAAMGANYENNLMRHHGSGSSVSEAPSERNIAFQRDVGLVPEISPSSLSNNSNKKDEKNEDEPGPSGLANLLSLDDTSPNADPLNGKKRNSLFQGLQKMGDKVRRGMSTPLQKIPHSTTFSDLFGDKDFKNNLPEFPTSKSDNRISDIEKLSADDILAKYQRPSIANEYGNNSNNDVLIDLGPPEEEAPRLPEDPTPYYSVENLTSCRAFLDTKRKLRLVLSNGASVPSVLFKYRYNRHLDEREDLMFILKSLLADAIQGRQHSTISQLRETIRSLEVFDPRGVRKILESLREEHSQRIPYLVYLQQSRVSLLKARSCIDKLLIRIGREKALIGECLVDLLIRVYLEGKDTLRVFYQEFSSLKVQDEKIDLLNRTLSVLFSRIPQSTLFRNCPDSLLNYVKVATERTIMGQIQAVAFYPNMEADRHRDEVFFKALTTLARNVNPDHPMLKIPLILQGEAPWPSAQVEIKLVNAYKSARDKLACIVRCCETISNLVSMVPNVGAVAADDVTPILVFVLIQANPPALLSNLQYIQSFAGSLLDGQEGYWWTQFTAAVEFIKTLL